MIPQQFIEEVQSRTDIVEIISGYIPLRRSGRNFKATCPFHGEKTPSFMVSPQKQIYHCFGCGAGGGVLQFIMSYEKVSFVEAVEMLANRAGLTVPSQNRKAVEIKTTLYDLVDSAADFFHQNLMNNKSFLPVLTYLSNRGIGKETIARFKIGYAFGQNSLLSQMRTKGYKLETLEKASLAVARDGRFKDLFQSRITFPIFDVRGRAVGFGARIWQAASSAPKYINSLENPLYSKREHLYGLNLAKEAILKEDFVIVVEGYLDMIIPFSQGICNVVSSSGTALTEEQIRLIRRYTKNIVLIFDSDTAGQNATLRALDLLIEKDLNVSIVELPGGQDPDSLIRKFGKEAFLSKLKEAKGFFEYKIRKLFTKYDCDTINGKTKIAQDMLVTIDKIKSEVEKFEYIKKLAERLKVREEIMIAEYKKVFAQGKTEKNSYFPSIVEVKQELLPITEKILLKFLITNSKAFVLMKKNLTSADFIHPISKKVVEYFFNPGFAEKSFYSSKGMGFIEDPSISSFVSSLIIDESIPSSNESFKESIAQVRKRRAQIQKEQLKIKITKAEKEGNIERLKELIGEYGQINNACGKT
ncbi:MAG: DNA primase [Candidatus Omnitrophica bacterium]|nr:DNA primase [Candidatus Omnitrophota bacterium]